MSVEWLPADWPVPSCVVAGSTLRGGGFGHGRYESLNLAAHVGDDPQAVARNRRAFIDSCELPAEPRWLTQVHGATVVDASAAAAGAEADAVLTAEPDVVCAVLTADCLPVVFAAGDGSEIAVAHAGWRGLCAGILEATVAAMHCPPSAVSAWFGPAISQPAFEVGDEVRQAFVRQDTEAGKCFEQNDRGRWQADLFGLARQRLTSAGLSGVYGGDRCTFGEPEAFFSYRRDGACGRMATFAYRRAGNA